MFLDGMITHGKGASILLSSSYIGGINVYRHEPKELCLPKNALVLLILIWSFLDSHSRT